MITVNENGVRNINASLLSIDSDIKASNKGLLAKIEALQETVDGMSRAELNVTPGSTYDINITGNASTATHATTADTVSQVAGTLTISSTELSSATAYNGSSAVTVYSPGQLLESTSSPTFANPTVTTINGNSFTPKWSAPFIPYVRTDGVMEVGKYIDFHGDAKDINDYDARIAVTHNSTYGNGEMTIDAANITAAKFTGSLNGNAATSSYPLGFSNRDGSQGWGNQTGTYITDWKDNTGGSVAFRRDCPSSGQCSMIIDGKIYQNEGKYEVIDSNTIGSQSVNYASSAGSVSATASDNSTATLVSGTMGSNDFFRVLVGGSNNSGYAEIATADDATEPIYVRQYSGTFSSLARTATLLDGSGNTSFPGTVSASSFSGNASSASHLLINGVTYNSNWYWNGQSGQPSWLWGSNDGTNMYVWNPSNFSVNYATSAASAVAATTAETANKIRTSSPSSPANGDIWMV